MAKLTIFFYREEGIYNFKHYSPLSLEPSDFYKRVIQMIIEFIAYQPLPPKINPGYVTSCSPKTVACHKFSKAGDVNM